MKKTLCFVMLLGSFALAGCSHPAYGPPPPPPPALDYRAIEAQGQHDGFDAARNDVATGRPPRFDRHPRYRNPPVPGPGWPSYRQGFRRGYDQFLHTPPPGAPPASY
jgi:hypothetical protein